MQAVVMIDYFFTFSQFFLARKKAKTGRHSSLIVLLIFRASSRSICSMDADRYSVDSVMYVAIYAVGTRATFRK